MGEKITGYHAIEESLKEACAGSILFLCKDSEKRSERLEALARSTKKVAIRKITSMEMDRMAGGADHRGALLELSSPSRFRQNHSGSGSGTVTTVKDFVNGLADGQGALVLILDGITDPQNMGAILRSADQFSVDLVMMPERRSAQANETVLRISSGAAQYVPTAVVTNLVREMELLQANNFWIYGADMDGENLPKVVFPARTAIVMGSEGDGMSLLVHKRCDQIVSIPMSGHIDSLNVSVAAGILLYEVRRQQGKTTAIQV